jgi:hypothetical protein
MNITSKLLKQFTVASLIIISLLIILGTTDAQIGPKPIFRDEKNAYFTFAPPTGWIIEKYDDPRTKVAFRHPNNKSIFIRLIVREEPGYTFSEMKKDAETTARQWTEKGIPRKVDVSEFLGVPATRTSADIPGTGSTLLWKFLIAGLHFNIQFAAPNEKELAKNLDEVTHSINSIVVSRPSKIDLEKVRKQQAASIIRLADLAVELGDKDTAVAILKDGLKEFPDSAEIKSKLAEYTGNKKRRK